MLLANVDNSPPPPPFLVALRAEGINLFCIFSAALRAFYFLKRNLGDSRRRMFRVSLGARIWALSGFRSCELI